MAYKRVEENDWVTFDENGFIDSTKALKLHSNGRVYFPSDTSPSFLYYPTAIKGLNANTGILEQTIPIVHQAIEPDFLEIDQNGYLWVQHYGSDHAPTEPAFQIYNPTDGSLVTTFGLYPANLWHGNSRIFDSVNNLMWLSKDANTIAAVSSISYTEIRTIAVTQHRGMGFDSDSGYLWVVNSGTSNLYIYNASTGALVATKTLSVSNLSGAYQFDYISSKRWMIVTAGNYFSEIWDTSTQTVVKVLYNTSQYRNLTEYLPYNDAIAGQKSSDSGDTYSYTSLDIGDVETSFDTILLPAFNPSWISCIDKTTSSIYMSGFEEGTGNYYIYKLTFEVTCDPRDISVREITLCSTEDTSSSNTNLENYDSFNRELILDLNLQAFSVYDLAHNNDTYIRDYIEVPSYIVTFTEDLIYVGSALVTDTSLVNLTVTGSVPKQENRNTDERREPFKFIVTTGTSISIAEYKDYSFVDWKSIDGVGYGYNSYLLTGYELSGDMVRQKQTTYLKLFFDRTEDAYTLDSTGAVVLDHQSGCKVQSQWDWNNSADNGKWGVPFQGYRLLRPQPTSPAAGDTFTYGERVIVTKNKLRGRGHCLSLLFVSECGKDTKLLGWGLGVTGLPIRRGKNTIVA